MRTGPNPDLVLIARLIHALILQLQRGDRCALNEAIEKAWEKHTEAWELDG